MIKTKERDFVEVNYIGKIKETNEIFDLTDVETARKFNIYNEKARYGSKIICLGENQILKSIDRKLVDKEPNQTIIIELKPEEGFGKKDPSLLKVVVIDTLKKQNINPFPGLQINASGLLGTIRSVNAGRVTIDFNHPLAGKNLIYEIKIEKIIEKDEEKIKSLVENLLGLSKEEYTLEVKENKANLTIKSIIPIQTKEQFKQKAKQLIPSLELVF